jgi:putative peptide maturation system protein
MLTNTLHQAMNATLDYLATLSHDGVCPTEAQARLCPLQERLAGTQVDLVWQTEAYDESVHYDALLRRPGEGTVSLSFCPDRALPWPLRGVHRWSDQDLLRVNHQVLTVDQAIACLDFIWEDRQLIDRLVNVCLIQETLAQDPINLSHDELQQAMDGFRRARRLYTAEATRHWIERRGMTHEQLERYVSDEAIIAKLRQQVTAGRVEEYFAQHQAAFDAAAIARIDVTDEELARRLAALIRSGDLDFYRAADQQFLAADRRFEQASPVRFTSIRRGQAPAELANAVFAAPPGTVPPAVPTENGYCVVRVLAVTPAVLDDVTRGAIEQQLFDGWLEERREAIAIEWNWGNAARLAHGEAAPAA